MNPIFDVITSKTLTYEQKVISLAREAENSLNVLEISNEAKDFQQKKIICDLAEGHAPYRPRYVLPDYQKFLREGSVFLQLPSASDLLSALTHLQIIYSHTPSITSFPVFLGELDQLLEPFITDENEARKLIRMFLIHCDRTLTDSFVHANIGPKATKAGRIILELERELVNAVPNLTLKYNDETPDDFAIEAIKTGLATAKPYFANHDLFVNDFGNTYGIASCYNGLPIGGGSFTLIRLNMKELAKESVDIENFMNTHLPKAVKLMCEIMDKRIEFLVEKSNFFETNFLVKEGFISQSRFTAMFGIHGLAECVNTLLNSTKIKEKFGHNSEANDLSVKIVKELNLLVSNHKNKYCQFSQEKFLLHAQCGIGSDVETSPGCRIPIGEEPEMFEQILLSGKIHPYFPTGISDIFTFDETSKKNPEYVLDIIKGSMKAGIRMFSFYLSDNDLIRITGYLVKRSEINKCNSGSQNLHDTVVLGAGAVESLHIFNRKVYA